MAGSISKQIFFDANHKRWRYSKRSFIALGSFILAAFCVLVGSIIVIPRLPILNLAKPQLAFRGVPNVPRAATDAPLIASSFTTQSFDVLVEQNKQLNPEPAQNVAARTKALGFYVNWDDNSLTSLRANVGKLDELVPEWLHLIDENGGIGVDDQTRQDQTVQFVRGVRPDFRIVPLINNYNSDTQDWDGVRLMRILGNETSRRALVGNILEYVRQNHFSGISIDFESVPDTAQNDLVLFMRELSATFHPLGLEVSQNIPLDDPSFDARVLGSSSDFLILMAYDEHSVYDTSAGPVSSQGWFTRAYAARLREQPAEKYVIALGGYGYDWTGSGSDGRETTFEDALTTAKESQGTVTLDTASFNPTYGYYDDKDILHHVWFLDAVSAFDEIVAARKLGVPYGYVLWRLGSEDPTYWNVITARDALTADVAHSLEHLQYGYDVNYDGGGEVLRVSSVPKDGARTIAYDQASGFITAETVTDFPAPYTITRWGSANKMKIALTFDDGPDDHYTPQVLDILKRYNVPATFFVVGMNANIHPDLLRQIVNQGSEIGNHTYTHPNITAISDKQFTLELDATERLFEGVLGRKSLLFRPPYAEDIEPATPDQVAPLVLTNALGYYTISMHIDPRDWSQPGTEHIVQDVLEQAQSGVGNIVLLHDGGGNRDQTIAALPGIIDGLRGNGFELVTVSDLVGLSRDVIMPPVSAREQILARINMFAFLSITGLNHFLQAMFFLGIILGVIRFLFIGILALAQYFYARFGHYRKFVSDFTPFVAVIIPAYNEAAVVVQTVGRILTSTYPRLRIIAIDDGSADGTWEKLNQVFGTHPLVTLLAKGNGGKASALNYGISQTTMQDEIIITLDADTLFQADTIEKLIRRFVDRRIGAVAGNAKVGNRLNILTRWQALEYITSQNLDRRAFEIINCISVVPGAVGAWRRDAILEAGGFSGDTLAEDADLTFSILRNGHRIAYDDEALAFTEAPDTVKNFVKQRFRWMYGTLQVAWKHRETLFRPRYGSLGFFAVPNVFVFQVFFPVISPLMDLTLVTSLLWVGWQKYQHPIGYDAGGTMQGMLIYYGLFLFIDMITGILPFFLERREQWSLIFYLPLQRFFYRQLMYYVAIKATFTALQGRLAYWGRFERKATARAPAA